jgi:lysyl-tRNA synthetase, class II
MVDQPDQPAGDPPAPTEAEHNALLAVRRGKLDQLRSDGIDPFPPSFPGVTPAAEIRAAHEGLEAGEETDHAYRVAGRLTQRRGQGKMAFLDLVDRSGRMQLQARLDVLGPEKMDRLLSQVDLGDIIGVDGTVFVTRRGELSLRIDDYTVLAKALRPPPDAHYGLHDVETRFRQRELDLMANEEARALFTTRARIVSTVRRFLDDRGFVEVETPVLQPLYGGAAARPFTTHFNALDRDLYLRIATELYLKRLIVGGLERVYELGKDFRNEGLSYKHVPEFTMVEWYEAYADYHDTMARIEELVETVARETTGGTEIRFRGHEADLKAPWRRLKLIDALEEQGLWTRDADELRSRLQKRDVDTSQDRSWAALVDHALSHFVEPTLIEPTILYDYPIELSPFARVTDDEPEIVERFEYFVGGTELGNAFTELNDPDEQAARFEQQALELGGEQGDPDYVEALAYGMPPTGGLGLGIDRLAMVLAGRDTIRDVILFPALRERG